VTPMSAKRERSGLGKRPPVTSSGTLLSVDASLATILAGLEGLELEGLRQQWRNHLGGEAPAHLPRWLLVKVLGHRLQVAAFGDLDRSVWRRLREETDEKGGRHTAPFDRRDAQTRDGTTLRPGALLVREWRGKLERVMVLEEGFAWNGRNFGSLSQIAKAMTGTSWNGHRFFGLRQTKATQGAARPLKGKRHGIVGLPPGSDEEPSALAPVGVGGGDHRNGAVVSPTEISS
jgi:Protein of unknown function (DUF2924)